MDRKRFDKQDLITKISNIKEENGDLFDFIAVILDDALEAEKGDSNQAQDLLNSLYELTDFVKDRYNLN
jgi:hypothetical protein